MKPPFRRLELEFEEPERYLHFRHDPDRVQCRMNAARPAPAISLAQLPRSTWQKKTRFSGRGGGSYSPKKCITKAIPKKPLKSVQARQVRPTRIILKHAGWRPYGQYLTFSDCPILRMIGS